MKRNCFDFPLFCLAAWLVLSFWGISWGKGSAETRNAEETLCGTSARRELNTLLKERYYQSRNRLLGRGRRLAPSQAASPAAATDVGDVAVIEDDGTILPEVNPFDLASRAVRFEPGDQGTYRVVSSSSTYDPTVGTPLTLADDDTAEVQLGFSFPFYGIRYDRIEVNSDGNLTFVTGDKESASRDLVRLLTGPPRLAPFFADLNPDAGTGGGGTISYRPVADGIVFTWNNVRQYNSSSVVNSFNTWLFKDGSIEFVYGAVATLSAVVGIAPGNGQGGVNGISFLSSLPAGYLAGAIVEVFVETSEISEAALTRLFYRTHPDEFDQIVVFTAFDYSIPGAFAYELNVKNEIQGLGLNQGDSSKTFGSNGKLRSFVLMGSLRGATHSFPSDPTLIFFRTYNTLEILAHEAAHRWIAYPLYQDGANATLDLLHSTDKAHWSFFFNSNASVMEGVRINDGGADKGDLRFTAVESTNKYSELDRYLMGYGSREAVPPLFFVQNPSVCCSWTLPSFSALAYGGTRKDFTVDAVVAANGVRVPSMLQSPKVFRQAFILLTSPNRPNTQPLDTQIARLQSIRDAWVPYFNQQTGGLGYAVTNLQSTPGTTSMQIDFPYFHGNSSRYTGIAVANWGSTPADVLFKAFDNSGGTITAPAAIVNPRMITIAPGAQIALLGTQIYGLSLNDPRNGWIQAQSTSSEVTSFFVDGDVNQNYLTGAVAGNKTYSSFYFTQARLGGSATPGSTFTNLIDVVNPSASAATLTFTLKDDSGIQGQATRTINSNGRLAEDLTSLFPGISKPRFKGYISVTSSVPVIGYEAIDAGTTIYSLPAQTAVAAGTLYSAQFASGKAGDAHYYTDLNLINTAGEERTAHIVLTGNDGRPVSGIQNPVDIPLPPNRQFLARGEDLFNLTDPAAASDFVEGSLVITTDGAGVIGDVTFGDAGAQKFIAALPFDGRPVSELVFSQVAQGVNSGPKPYYTGLAMYNPNATPVSVKLVVFSEYGAQTGTATITLNGGNRLSRTLPELVPEVKEQVRGYIRLTSSGGPVSAFELFGSQNFDFLTAVPAQPIGP